jgi:hypothetical protein
LLFLERIIDFQHGGGGHLGKWRRRFALVFFGLSICFYVCVSNFIEIKLHLPALQLFIA